MKTNNDGSEIIFKFGEREIVLKNISKNPFRMLGYWDVFFGIVISLIFIVCGIVYAFALGGAGLGLLFGDSNPFILITNYYFFCGVFVTSGLSLIFYNYVFTRKNRDEEV